MFIFLLLYLVLSVTPIVAYGGAYTSVHITHSLRADKADYHFKGTDQGGHTQDASLKGTPTYYGGKIVGGYEILYKKDKYVGFEGYLHTHNHTKKNKTWVAEEDGADDSKKAASIHYTHQKRATVGASFKWGTIKDDHAFYVKFSADLSPSRYKIKTFDKSEKVIEQTNFNKLSWAVGIGGGFEYTLPKMRIGIGHTVFYSNTNPLKNKSLCMSTKYVLHHTYIALTFPLEQKSKKFS